MVCEGQTHFRERCGDLNFPTMNIISRSSNRHLSHRRLDCWSIAVIQRGYSAGVLFGGICLVIVWLGSTNWLAIPDAFSTHPTTKLTLLLLCGLSTLISIKRLVMIVRNWNAVHRLLDSIGEKTQSIRHSVEAIVSAESSEGVACKSLLFGFSKKLDLRCLAIERRDHSIRSAKEDPCERAWELERIFDRWQNLGLVTAEVHGDLTEGLRDLIDTSHNLQRIAWKARGILDSRGHTHASVLASLFLACLLPAYLGPAAILVTTLFAAVVFGSHEICGGIKLPFTAIERRWILRDRTLLQSRLANRRQEASEREAAGFLADAFSA